MIVFSLGQSGRWSISLCVSPLHGDQVGIFYLEAKN
jgi:hypothetical protein